MDIGSIYIVSIAIRTNYVYRLCEWVVLPHVIACVAIVICMYSFLNLAVSLLHILHSGHV